MNASRLSGSSSHEVSMRGDRCQIKKPIQGAWFICRKQTYGYQGKGARGKLGDEDRYIHTTTQKMCK